MKSSTDIVRLLQIYEQSVAKNTVDVASIRSSIAKNTSSVEKYLNHIGIRATLVRNAAKEKAQRKRSDVYLKHVADAAKRRSDFKPPKKPDDEDKDKKEQKERITNDVSKTEFFKRIKNEYRHVGSHYYRRIANAIGLSKLAEFIRWDYIHNELEIFNKAGEHLGAFDPATLQQIKNAVVGRRVPDCFR